MDEISIFKISIDSQRIDNEKWAIKQKLGKFSWEEVCAEAMKFLMEADHAGIN